jgi:hypothetical protein
VSAGRVGMQFAEVSILSCTLDARDRAGSARGANVALNERPKKPARSPRTVSERRANIAFLYVDKRCTEAPPT